MAKKSFHWARPAAKTSIMSASSSKKSFPKSFLSFPARDANFHRPMTVYGRFTLRVSANYERSIPKGKRTRALRQLLRKQQRCSASVASDSWLAYAWCLPEWRCLIVLSRA
jgi:hypothetical protein